MKRPRRLSYSWLDLVLWLAAIALLIPLLVHWLMIAMELLSH